MATSGSFSTSQVTPVSKTWYWDFSWWVTGWSGNTATVHWEAIARCTSGVSGQQYIANYGFAGGIYNQSIGNPGGNFVKDTWGVSGDFTISGGTTFSAWIEAHPYSSAYSSYGDSAPNNWTLDNNVVTPTVTCSITGRTETTVSASMSVTNNGNASIVDNYIDLFTDSGCTNKVGTINGTSGTFSGLSANTTYYARANASNGTYRGYSGVPSTTTYSYPYCKTAPDFTIGNNVTFTFYNPLNRTMQIQMWSYNSSSFINSTKINVTGTSYTFKSSTYATNLYNSIPTVSSSQYNIDVWYGSNKAVKSGGTYKVSGNNAQAPTFTDFNYTDTDSLASYLTGKNGNTNPGVLVAGLSDCIFSIPTSKKATSNYGATLDKYNFSWPNGSGTSSTYSSSAEVSNHVYDGNTSSISVTAYDKRGQYKTVSKSITLISPSHATGNLTGKRNNGVDTGVYLNGSLSYWAGDWAGGSNRPNTVYKIEYRVNKTGSYYNIYSSINNNKTSSTSSGRTTWSLASDTIQLHANGSSGGFPIGSTYTVEIFVSAGQTFNNTEYYYDNRQLVSTFTISSGSFGLTRYKASSGEYCYGINRLPDSNGLVPLYVRGQDIQVRAESSVSNVVLGFGIGNGGTNRGIFDHTPGRDKWMLYYDGSRNVMNDNLHVYGALDMDTLYIQGRRYRYDFTKTMQITTDWKDTGISASNLAKGVYAFKISNVYVSGKTWQQAGIWGGIMTWYDSNTNASEGTEFPIYPAHHAHNGNMIYIRTLSHSNGAMTLQLKGNTTFASSSISFEFARLL